MKTEQLTSAKSIRIGALARLAGCSVPTIRYYEDVGLIPRASRRSSGHRVFDPAAVQLLSFVRRCRDLGFTVEQTRALVALADGQARDCVDARDIAEANLKAVRAKLIELMTLERTLDRFVQQCTLNCVGGPAPQCTIFKDLGLKTGNQAGCC